MEAKQTPLIDLLESVPRDAVLVVEHDQFDSSSYPIGRLCHEAAATLKAAWADAERYRWLKKSAFCNVWARGDGIALVVPRTPVASIDSKIDAGMAKENSND